MVDCGEIKPTKLVLKKSKAFGVDLLGIIARHSSGDFGDITPLEKTLNHKVLNESFGNWVFSRYKINSLHYIVRTDLRVPETFIELADEK